eukprot:tig00021254_g19723.t1
MINKRFPSAQCVDSGDFGPNIITVTLEQVGDKAVNVQILKENQSRWNPRRFDPSEIESILIAKIEEALGKLGA